MRRFRSDMTGHEAVGGAGKTAVREQRDGISESCTNECSSDCKHLAHAGAALGPFIADHNHIASFDRAVVNGGKCGLFTIEYTRGAAEVLQIVPGNFHYAAFGSEIALQNDQ